MHDLKNPDGVCSDRAAAESMFASVWLSRETSRIHRLSCGRQDHGKTVAGVR
jgi:hypothetical protein